jgi:nicotinate-nucleotide adenylyltransferase
MQIGLLGGTFDPIHLGHLILAERVREEARLDAVWFLPSFQPPHKQGDAVTAYEHRTAMLALAIESNRHFRMEQIERELPPPSYTVQTLKALRQQYNNYQFHLIVGADCLPDLPKWYEPQNILKQANIIAVPRPDIELWTAARLAAELAMPVENVKLTFIESPLMQIASREIRARVMAGKTIRYLVPAAVEDYIHSQKLYAHPRH